MHKKTLKILFKGKSDRMVIIASGTDMHTEAIVTENARAMVFHAKSSVFRSRMYPMNSFGDEITFMET